MRKSRVYLLAAGVAVVAGGAGFAASNLIPHATPQAGAAEAQDEPTIVEEVITDPAILEAMDEADLDLTSYGRNADGQTFGTLLNANSYEEAPDLVSVWIDENTIGYVSRDYFFPNVSGIELNDREGNAVPVPAYASDGKTEIGVWVPNLGFSEE